MKKFTGVSIRVLALLMTVMILKSEKMAAQAQTDTLLPGWFRIPKTELKIKVGGYVKLDFIHDLDPIGSPDFFDVTKIPTDGSTGKTSHFNAKETRLFVDVRNPSKFGELRGYVEGDFYGSGGSFRLRHGYVEIGGKLLAGQTWSNFMDEDIIPPTLDFEKPGAYAFVRHGLIRWKQRLSKHSYLSLAVEEPSAVTDPSPVPGKLETPLPDFTARFRQFGGWGHIQLSGFVGFLNFSPTTGDKDELALWGLNLSGQVNFFKKDRLIYQALYGPGIARYRGGKSATFNPDGKLESISAVGFTVGYLHYWTPVLSSLGVFNYGENDLESTAPASDAISSNYSAINLIWNFTHNAFAGIEYLRGLRKDLDGSSGTANRIQLSVRYSFNM